MKYLELVVAKVLTSGQLHNASIPASYFETVAL